MRLSPGDRLGPYEIVSPLGAGGMGEVYRARDPRLGRDVAVKVLPERLARDPEALARFRLEAHAVAVLSHPNIRVLHDVGQEGDVHYAAMELLEGRSLWATLKEGPLSEGRATGIALQIASGLSAAHEKGIVHRDLKPENVFLCEDGLVKVLDFGLARHTDPASPEAARLTEPGLIVGTPAYMSPEQVRGTALDARSDIFSFGSVLWEMVTGRPAFDAPTSAETMHAILKGEPSGGEAISAGMRKLLSHCLEKSPSGRFQSARDVGFALEALSHASTAHLTPRTATVRRRPSRRALVALGVVTLVAASVAAGILVGGRARRPDDAPRFSRVTFRRGNVVSARFTADGQSVVHSAAWEDMPADVFVTRLGRPESRALQLPNAVVRSVSRDSELAAIVQRQDVYHPGGTGTLVRVPLEGGAPRSVAEDVVDACFAPDGASLALVRRTGDVWTLEYPEGRVLLRSPVRLHQVRLSPGGDSIAFIENAGDATRLHIVGKDGRRTLSRPVGSETTRLAWHPSGREVWLSNRQGPPPWGLFAMSLEGRMRPLLPGIGLVLHDVSADGRALVETFFLRDGIALSRALSREVDRSWLEDSAVADLSADGGTLLFGEVGDGGGPMASAYLSRAEGGPPVRLGDGLPCSLSPDGRSVLVDLAGKKHALVEISTGAGPARPLDTGGVEPAGCAFYLPGGRDVVFTGRRGAEAWRAYRLDLADGKAQPLGPEGHRLAVRGVASPTGDRVILADPAGRPVVVDVASGAARPLPALAPNEGVLQWTLDDRLVVRRPREIPAHLDLVNVQTGERTPFRSLAPEDRSGIIAIEEVAVTRDLSTYAYSFSRVLASALHVVDGLEGP